MSATARNLCRIAPEELGQQLDQEELESDLGWMLDSEELVLVLDQEQAQDCQGLLQEGMSTMAPTRPPRESYSIGRCCCHYTPTLLVRMPGRRTTTPHWPCCQSLSRTGQLGLDLDLALV
mmetsp:Transcript_5640/g.10287  ORF Transcript_5640/g.10287 Transcript_5640/m.10287 type:complete len:120 (+) Transcript_5640:2024-2383(+)